MGLFHSELYLRIDQISMLLEKNINFSLLKSDRKPKTSGVREEGTDLTTHLFPLTNKNKKFFYLFSRSYQSQVLVTKTAEHFIFINSSIMTRNLFLFPIFMTQFSLIFSLLTLL